MEYELIQRTLKEYNDTNKGMTVADYLFNIIKSAKGSPMTESYENWIESLLGELTGE